MDQDKNEISIELHYNFINDNIHSINFYTRNKCSLVQAQIISYIISELYPNEHFDILSLPPMEGSFKDLTVVKFLNKNQGFVMCVTGVIGVIFAGLLFNSQSRANNTTADFNTLEIIEKCKNLGLDDQKIEKIKNICDSYYPKKQKNIFYDTIILNKTITGIEPTITNGDTTLTKKIKKEDFLNYKEEIPKEKEFLITNLSGNIQLSQPFIDKQLQYGRGVAWKGIYYGNNIFDDNDNLVIEDGESIFFYMQDDQYKKQILDQEVSFKNNDNIRVIFDIDRYYDYVSNKYGKPRLYVKIVEAHNDNLVEHKKQLAIKIADKKSKQKNENQISIFDLENK